MSDARPRVVVVGGGTMGLAAAWALARRGADVELFERFGHVHNHGSHGGHTRAIRHAYHEGSDYVALVTRADREWTALGQRLGQELLVRCGLLEFGPDAHPEFVAARVALRANDIPHELLDANAAASRYGFSLPQDWLACLAPDSGYLRVAPCLDALRREAEAYGARLHYGVRVREVLVASGPSPRVLLEDGTVVAADRVVVAAGAWARELLGPSLAPARELEVLRRVLAWTVAAPEVRASLRQLPVWAGFVPEGFVYGFPDNDEGHSGFKLACHTSSDPALGFMNEPVSPDAVDRDIHELDLRPLREFLRRYRPDAGEIVHATTCLYTNTPSGDFLLDRHPDDPRIVVAAGFSGHGFKFAPAIGHALAELALDGDSDLALPRFRLGASA